MKIFSTDYLNSLTLRAENSPRKRIHQNIHDNFFEPCQRLFNAVEPNSYFQPHRHLTDPKVEMLIAVRGSMVFVTFDNDGKILEVIPFGANLKNEKPGTIGLEVCPEKWHTVIALEPGSILLEVKAGPFDPTQPKDLAPWAPIEGSENVSYYLSDLLEYIKK
jgi:cupin fold WbuC family metalloprotein